MDTDDLVKLLPPGYEKACFDKKVITRKWTIKNSLDVLQFALLRGVGKISDIAFMKTGTESNS